MIMVLCRSEHFFSTLRAFWDSSDLIRLEAEDLAGIMARVASEKPSAVVYEPSFFIDPAPFRIVSPATKFVVLGAPGDEQRTEEALRYGAAAVMHKPLVEGEVRGVLALVR